MGYLSLISYLREGTSLLFGNYMLSGISVLFGNSMDRAECALTLNREPESREQLFINFSKLLYKENVTI